MNRAATIALAPLSLVYGAVIKTRLALYENGTFRTYKVTVPVISVGNITTGGTGKSPLVEWIARQLAARGQRICILTRGYGRSNSQQRVIVSDGNQILSRVEQAGDEPLMLAEALQGKAAVVCDANRVSAANWAIENLKSDVLILDDGFQHLQIAREVDIVTIDATNVCGWLLPAGRLREPVNGLRRADCVVITRAPEPSDADLVQRIKEVTDAPVMLSEMRIQRTRQLTSAKTEASDAPVPGQRLAAFCAIGNPLAFFEQLRKAKFDLCFTASFRDHHRYAQSDIDRLTRASIERGAKALITTAKDEVKLRPLRFALPCYIADIEMEFVEPDKLLALIDRKIRKHR